MGALPEEHGRGAPPPLVHHPCLRRVLVGLLLRGCGRAWFLCGKCLPPLALPEEHGRVAVPPLVGAAMGLRWPRGPSLLPGRLHPGGGCCSSSTRTVTAFPFFWLDSVDA